jgi:hypothetical protein
MSDLQKLYQERAELAELESDCDEVMKYTWRDGLFYRFFSWVKRRAENSRAEVQADIDELKGEDRG